MIKVQRLHHVLFRLLFSFCHPEWTQWRIFFQTHERKLNFPFIKIHRLLNFETFFGCCFKNSSINTWISANLQNMSIKRTFFNVTNRFSAIDATDDSIHWNVGEFKQFRKSESFSSVCSDIFISSWSGKRKKKTHSLRFAWNLR